MQADERLLHLRQMMEKAVERLIDAMDALDGDPDLESYLAGSETDMEVQCEDEGGQCDDEGEIESDTGADDMGDAWRVIPDSINQEQDGYRSNWLCGTPNPEAFERRDDA